jgi:hypothetical protein
MTPATARSSHRWHERRRDWPVAPRLPIGKALSPGLFRNRPVGTALTHGAQLLATAECELGLEGRVAGYAHVFCRTRAVLTARLRGPWCRYPHHGEREAEEARRTVRDPGDHDPSPQVAWVANVRTFIASRLHTGATQRCLQRGTTQHSPGTGLTRTGARAPAIDRAKILLAPTYVGCFLLNGKGATVFHACET